MIVTDCNTCLVSQISPTMWEVRTGDIFVCLVRRSNAQNDYFIAPNTIDIDEISLGYMSKILRIIKGV